MPPYLKNIGEQFGRGDISIGWPWRLLVFSLFAVSLAIFLYLAMIFGYKPYLNNQIKIYSQKIDKLGSAVKEEEKASFLTFYSQLVNLQTILDKHIYGSSFFNFLEKNTSPRVSYLNVNLLVSEHLLKIVGLTASFNDLAQQIAVFDRNPFIKRVVLENVGFANEGLRFSLTLFLKPEFLLNPDLERISNATSTAP